MKTSTISHIAHALPAKVLSYEELAARFGEREVASIAKMSGIRNRRVVAPGQCASDLAIAAAKRLFDHAKIDPATLDAIVFCSQTPDYRIPATAAHLQAVLGLPEKCCAFDINQACPSFIYGMNVAHSMVVAGTAGRVLLINADALTTLVNPRDRGLATLHGDGAAATIVHAIDSEKGGVEFFEFGNSGSDYDRLIVPAGASKLKSSAETAVEKADESGSWRSQNDIFMDGAAIFHFAVHKVKGFLQDVLKKRNLLAADYDMVLFHQANKTLVDLLYKGIQVPPEKRFY